MSFDTLTRFSVEGPGSVPVRCGNATARGMFDAAVMAATATGPQQIERDMITLHLYFDRLPDAVEDAILQVGTPDLAATNFVSNDSPYYRVAARRPVGDGLLHQLLLEGGP